MKQSKALASIAQWVISLMKLKKAERNMV